MMKPGKETFEALQEVRALELGEIECIPLTESKDPAIAAYELITNFKGLEKMAVGAVKQMVADFAKSAKEVEGHKRFGGHHIAALDIVGQTPLRAARRFKNFGDLVLSNVEDVVRKGGRRVEDDDGDGDGGLEEAIKSVKSLVAFVESNMTNVKGRVADLKADRGDAQTLESLESSLKAMLNGVREYSRYKKYPYLNK